MTVAERPTEVVHVLDALKALRAKHRGGAFRPAGGLVENLDRNGTLSDPDDPFGGPKLITDPAAYGSSVLDRTLRELADTGTGSRNAAAHKAGQVVGRHVGAGLVADAGGALNDVIDACRRNGLVDDDGLDTVQASVASGYQWGLEHPVEWEQAPSGSPVDAVIAIIDPSAPPPSEDSWALLPVLLGDGEDDDPPPALLARSDGKHLLYAGKTNSLVGESESGKTWVALHAIAQALAAGDVAVMLDFEDSRRGARSRLRNLGLPNDDLDRLYYASPDEPLSAEAAARLSADILARRPGLIVVDGYNAAMTLHGYDLMDNKDVTKFNQQVIRPLARTGAAVVTIDHVTKNKEGRGNYAIGAQAKRADVSGASLGVEVVTPFGRGLRGKLRLTVLKDRPGHVRGIAAGAKIAGDVVLDSKASGDLAVRIYAPPDDAADPLGATKRKIIAYLSETPLEAVPSNQEDFAKALHVAKADVGRALTTLVAEGEIEKRFGRWGLTTDAFRVVPNRSGTTEP